LNSEQEQGYVLLFVFKDQQEYHVWGFTDNRKRLDSGHSPEPA